MAASGGLAWGRVCVWWGNQCLSLGFSSCLSFSASPTGPLPHLPPIGRPSPEFLSLDPSVGRRVWFPLGQRLFRDLQLSQLDVRVGREETVPEARGAGLEPGKPELRGPLQALGEEGRRKVCTEFLRASALRARGRLSARGGPWGCHWEDRCGGGARSCGRHLGPAGRAVHATPLDVPSHAAPDGAWHPCALVQGPGPGPGPQPWHCPPSALSRWSTSPSAMRTPVGILQADLSGGWLVASTLLCQGRALAALGGAPGSLGGNPQSGFQGLPGTLPPSLTLNVWVLLRASGRWWPPKCMQGPAPFLPIQDGIPSPSLCP